MTTKSQQTSSYFSQYGTHYALLSGKIVSVGMWARNPLGGPSWHTSEGVVSDVLLCPCNETGIPLANFARIT